MTQSPEASSNQSNTESKNLAQKISVDLGLQIIRGEIKTGQLLPTEHELSESLKVSRSAVREAFKLLAAKGMIKSKRRKGTIVTELSEWNVLDPEMLHWVESSGYSYQILHELLQIRFAIEPEATAIVAKNRELTDFSVMAKSLRVMENPDASIEELRNADISFHQGILDATGNRYFKQMKPLLRTALVFCDVFAENDNFFDTTLRINTDEHRNVLTAMLDGRHEDARKLSYDMISRIEGFLNTLLEKQGAPV